MIRDREEGQHTEKDLRARFNALDKDGSGKVDMSEYLQWSLKDALSRASDRVVDIFRAWDVDRSGSIDKREFRKAIKVGGALPCSPSNPTLGPHPRTPPHTLSSPSPSHLPLLAISPP